MFKPKYHLSTQLLQNVTTCERFYGQLEGLRIPKEIELNLERSSKVRAAYISNSIEGNPLSLPEVTNLLLDERVPVNRNEKEVVNYFKILKNLKSYGEKKISLNAVLRFHGALLKGVNSEIAGKIRDKAIIVGKYRDENGKAKLQVKHNPPTHKKIEIEKLLQDLINWTNHNNDPIVIKAAIFHHQFVYIHPFEDGNGRTCRLLTTLLFLQAGYDINKYFVLDDYYDIDRLAYSDALNSADKGNNIKWLVYFSDGVKYSLQSAISRVKSAIGNLQVSRRPTSREQEVLKLLQTYKEMSSSDIVKKLGISRQQAHSLLASLVSKGFLEKKGATKSSYYFLR